MGMPGFGKAALAALFFLGFANAGAGDRIRGQGRAEKGKGKMDSDGGAKDGSQNEVGR